MAGIPINGTLVPNGPFPIIKGDAVIGVYTDLTRPDPTTVNPGFIIANSTSGTLEWSDGTSWHESQLPPDGAGSRILIYVRSSGSDSTGNGTSGNPFATPDHALAVSGVFLNHSRIVIDITGMTWRPTQSNRLVWPGTIQASRQAWFDYPGGFTNPQFGTFSDEADVTFQAVPTQTDTITGYTNTHDTATGMVTLTVPGKAWTVNSLVGKYVMGPFNYEECGCIVSNTSDTVLLAANHNGFVSSTLGVYELSATWQPDDSTTDDLSLCGNASIQFNGVSFQPNSGGISGVLISDIPYARFIGCTIAQITLMPGANFPVYIPSSFSGCHITGVTPGTNDGYSGIDLSGSSVTFSNCFFDSVVFTRELGTTNSHIQIGNSYAYNCAPLLHSNQGQEYQNESGPPINYDPIVFTLEGLWIDSSPGNAIQVFGGKVHLGGIHISNCAGDAIFIDGTGRVCLTYRCSSSNVTGYGVHVVNGGHFICTAVAAGITGTAGHIKVGGRPARSWTDFATNPPQYVEIDYNDLSRVSYDIVAQNFSAGALAMDYAPTTDADWPEGAPATVGAALDTLAARDLKVATVSGGGTPVIDFAVNKYVILQLGSTATTGLTATDGIDGELYTLRVAQDTSGSRTVGGWPSNFYFDDDASPTLTTIGSKSDTFLFVYDAATSHFYQLGGKTNMGPSS